MKFRSKLFGACAAIMMSAGALTISMPAAAQEENIAGRVKKLEKEVRAVQRKVFPNGAGKFFEPEIKPDANGANSSTSSSTSAVSDLIARVDALETQLATLTGTVEKQGNEMRSLDSRLAAVEAGLKTTETVDAGEPATTEAKTPKAEPSDKRTAAISGIEKPATGDAFEDSYLYGYRLWAAKHYPEAQVQLKKTADTYPKHKRASFARNLLGRAWLDDKKPATAVKIFYDNYKIAPRGGRAPDSLYFLGVSLTRLGKTKEACEAFGQLESAYPDSASGRLAARLSSGRAKAKCN